MTTRQIDYQEFKFSQHIYREMREILALNPVQYRVMKREMLADGIPEKIFRNIERAPPLFPSQIINTMSKNKEIGVELARR